MSDGQPSVPINRSASPGETGKYCPYCRFPLKERAAVVECGDCEAVHHSECWQDNGGCAVMGCASAPTMPDTAYVPSGADAPPAIPSGKSTPPPPPTGDAPAGQPTATPPSAGPAAQHVVDGKSSRGVLIAAISLGAAALVVIVVAAILALTRGDVVNQPVAAATESDSAPNSEEREDDGASGVLPDQSESEMAREMKQTLFEFHDDIVSDDFRGAWLLLSTRKRQQARDETGYEGWKKNQASLQPYLDTSGLRMRVISVDDSSGVATVDATGMSWSQPGASCSEWAGVTWLKYERDGWYYDPGYSTTSERENKWKSRFSELLGGEC